MTQGQQSTVTGAPDSCPDCSESEACREYSGSSDRPAVAPEMKRWDMREARDRALPSPNYRESSSAILLCVCEDLM
jgi:hypothetical protein